jgi:hypothetical protein
MDGAAGRFSMSPTLCRNAVSRSTGRPCLIELNALAGHRGILLRDDPRHSASSQKGDQSIPH